MMIIWQFENAFKISENISKVSISFGFQGQQSGDRSSLREFRGRGLKKLALEDIFNSVAFQLSYKMAGRRG